MVEIRLVGFKVEDFAELKPLIKEVLQAEMLLSVAFVVFEQSCVWTPMFNISNPLVVVTSDDQDQLRKAAIAVNKKLGVPVRADRCQIFLYPTEESEWKDKGRKS